MQTVVVPHSWSVKNYIKKGDFDGAYAVACLGVTNKDFMNLGLAAHWGMNLEVARKCFIRCRDMKYIDLVADTEEGLKKGEPAFMFRALSLAYQSKFHEAAKEYAEGGHTRGQGDGDVHGNANVRRSEGMGRGVRQDARRRRHLPQDFVNRQAEWAEETTITNPR